MWNPKDVFRAFSPGSPDPEPDSRAAQGGDAKRVREAAMQIQEWARRISDPDVRAVVVDVALVCSLIAEELERDGTGAAKITDFLDYHLDKARDVVRSYIELAGQPRLSAKEIKILKASEPAVREIPALFEAHLHILRRDRFGALDLASESLAVISMGTERPEAGDLGAGRGKPSPRAPQPARPTPAPAPVSTPSTPAPVAPAASASISVPISAAPPILGVRRIDGLLSRWRSEVSALRDLAAEVGEKAPPELQGHARAVAVLVSSAATAEPISKDAVAAAAEPLRACRARLEASLELSRSVRSELDEARRRLKTLDDAKAALAGAAAALAGTFVPVDPAGEVPGSSELAAWLDRLEDAASRRAWNAAAIGAGRLLEAAGAGAGLFSEAAAKTASLPARAGRARARMAELAGRIAPVLRESSGADRDALAAKAAAAGAALRVRPMDVSAAERALDDLEAAARNADV